ncbi:MAG: ribosome assembly factor SBDS [Candidatus Micrarchaeota archaeon]
MASLDKAIVAHIKVDGAEFQILVDPDLALMYKLGQKKELNNVLVVEEVFEDAKKGERHKSSALQKAFGTTDVFSIAEKIIKTGHIALTTDQKRRMVKEKRKQIAVLIAKEATDPRTGAPHPLARIENAMENIRLDVDPIKDASEQVEEVLDALKLTLPIKLAKRKIAVKVGPEYAQKIYGMLKNHGIEKEQWTNDGSLIAVVTVPAGLAGEFYDRLNKATGASAETKVIE